MKMMHLKMSQFHQMKMNT